MKNEELPFRATKDVDIVLIPTVPIACAGSIGTMQ